jgi:hypothetical protein
MWNPIRKSTSGSQNILFLLKNVSRYITILYLVEIENEKDKQHRDSSSSRSSSRPKNKKKHRE